MNAIHTVWTKPRGGFFSEDFDIFTTVLSAMKWREKNGKIKLCADKDVLAFYEKAGLLHVWDEVEELCVDDDINPVMFWAAGKLFALRNQAAPVAVLDTDFIVWERLFTEDLPECTVIHMEDITREVYPERDFFKMKDGYELTDFDPDLKAANGAFVIYKSDALIRHYTQKSIAFMKNSTDCGDFLRYMVFAEQRLLPMCVKELGMNMTALCTIEELFSKEQKRFTHTWGMKQQMRDDDKLRRSFCQSCKKRIKLEYPELYEAVLRAAEGK